MIEIKITITETEIPDSKGMFYGHVQAMPESFEPVGEQECFIRDLIMNHVKTIGIELMKIKGVKGFIAEVPVKRKEKNESQDSNDRRS
jgi:hypothetical protein